MNDVNALNLAEEGEKLTRPVVPFLLSRKASCRAGAPALVHLQSGIRIGLSYQEVRGWLAYPLLHICSICTTDHHTSRRTLCERHWDSDGFHHIYSCLGPLSRRQRSVAAVPVGILAKP